jgi:uncharacterized protein involved in exopolysaccharide biosynthesis
MGATMSSETDRVTPDGAMPDRTHQGGDEAAILTFLNVLLRYRGRIILLPLLFMALGVAIAMASPRNHMARASFLLQKPDAAQSRLAGLAAQLGVQMGAAAAETPQLYADLLRSRRVLQTIAVTDYQFVDGDREYHGTVPELFELTADTPRKLEEKTLGLLRESVSARTNYETGVIAYSVSMPWPALSEQVAEHLFRELAAFNLESRRSRAAAEREFVEERLADARVQLRGAEDAVQTFLQANRSFQQAPRLVFEFERLQRTLTERQAVYTMLSQATEQARIEEVRDTPVLTLLEMPAGSATPQGRGTVLRGILMFLLGLIVALAWSYFSEYLRRSRERQAPELQEFLALRREALGGLRPRSRKIAASR